MNINKKSFLLLIFIALGLYITGFLSSYPYLLEFDRASSSKLDTIRSIAEYSTMFVSLLLFCILFLRKNIFLKIVKYFLILALTLNFGLSASCFFIYKQGFNVGMMLSIFDTNVSETMSMVKTLVAPILTSLCFGGLLLVFTNSEKQKHLFENHFFKKYKGLFYFVSILWILMPYGFYLKHKYVSNRGGGFMIKNVLYHLDDIKRTLDMKRQIDEITKTKVDYNLVKIEDNDIQNIVILVGESARKQNMSLYGYPKNTTPNAVAEKQNMLLFENAHSPASITNLAVPIVLSNVDVDTYSRDITKLSDNILNVANHLGYETHWYSTQGGAHGITAIASFAKNKKWLNSFDEVLLSNLRDALKNKTKKKLIVLHINGSHPHSCDQYPKNKAVWNGGIDECYDNSVHYTDEVMGQIFKELRNTNSVMVYISDHGQKRDEERYIHGDYKEATEVPYFIWYSDKINSENKGKEISELTTTATLYNNVLQLMGVKNPKTIDNSGKFLKLDLKPIQYKDLE